MGAALRGRPVRFAVAAAAGSALVLAAAWPAATHWIAEEHPMAGAGPVNVQGLTQAGGHRDRVRQRRAAALAARDSQQAEIFSVAVAAAPADYANPLRRVKGLVPERIDMGVDFAGWGPVYAIGHGVITNATGDLWGWPGGGWITYRLTDGPDAGLMVYVAEDILPTVKVGQHVTSSTVVGTMFSGGDGIETGWAQPTGLSAESALPVAGGIGGNGPFPTRVGLNFEELLQSLGAPTAPNRDQLPNGLLPPEYPANQGQP